MKKVLLLAAVFTTLSLASCSNNEKTAADYAKEGAALVEELNNSTDEAEIEKIQEKINALEKEIQDKGLEEQVQEELIKLNNN